MVSKISDGNVMQTESDRTGKASLLSTKFEEFLQKSVMQSEKQALIKVIIVIITVMKALIMFCLGSNIFGPPTMAILEVLL